MEFVTETLVKQVASEVQQNVPEYLLTYALSLASAKEYIRQTRKRLLPTPVLLHLGATHHRKGVVENSCDCLDLLRSRDLDDQGYGPTNSIHLLQQLKGHLQGIDLSGLSFREAALQGVICKMPH